jgi:hypothetical protein
VGGEGGGVGMRMLEGQCDRQYSNKTIFVVRSETRSFEPFALRRSVYER